MSQYTDLFLQEAGEQLEILEQETLKLEKEPSQERLQLIFRAAHTLKGSARAMGFQHFAELTHEMENVLDNLRNGVFGVNTEIADALFGCLDSLQKMTESIAAGTGDELDVKALVSKLQTFVGGSTTAAPVTTVSIEKSDEAPASNFESKLTEDQVESLKAATEQGTVWHGKFRLTEDCAMKYVRVFMVVNEIQKQGELLISVPDSEQLEEEAFDFEFELIFQTTEPVDELKKRVDEVSEMAWYEICEFAAAQIASIQEAVETTAVKETNAPEAAAVQPAEGLPPAATPIAAAKKSADTGQTVRVDVARLDNLMNLVGELVIDRTRIAQIGSDLGSRLNDPNIDALAETVSHIHRITSDLQDQIMKARMMPIESVFNRFPRVIRDLAQKLDKDVRLEMGGGETELDRSVIEVIGDPLLHILRNSLDHGLETPDEREKLGKPKQGLISLTAKHQENHIVIEIIDDGKGIDVERVKRKAVESGLTTREAADKMSDKEALQFIFASGLSTAKEVSEVSGRGVGMDIVRSNIQKLGGIIDLETTIGEGTRFTLRLPLTLAIIRGLLVEVLGVVYVIPLGSVVETLLIDRQSIQKVNRKEIVVIRGVTTPIVRLAQLFGREKRTEDRGSSGQSYVVIVGLADQRVGLIVDNLVGEREVVIKSLSRYCGDVSGVSGATILGDGNVALIMDVNGIVQAQAAA